MYTWGYIKNVTLAKLDLQESEAEKQNLLGRFYYFANEAITQICSTIKPKHTFFSVNVTNENIGNPINMPDDFISFGNDVNKIMCDGYVREAYDDDFDYLGDNQILPKRIGTLMISYNARWITFGDQDDKFQFVSNDDPKNGVYVPMDILDCLPSYIASQCFKIDDEYKANVFRNEYEIFLARIDDTNFRNTKTFKIEGDW